jgi:hypothetical protein
MERQGLEEEEDGRASTPVATATAPTMPIGLALPWRKKLLSLVYADKE